MRARLATVVACGAAALSFSGCAGTQDEPAATVAQDFLDHVEEGDGEAACSLLAPAARSELEDAGDQPCGEAVLEEDTGTATRPVEVQVYDSMAQVRFGAATVFLSTFDGDWLVVGAACTATPGDQPYDCSIQVS